MNDFLYENGFSRITGNGFGYKPWRGFATKLPKIPKR